MSLINIINESFDQVLKHSQSKKKRLKESPTTVSSEIAELKSAFEDEDADLYELQDLVDDLYYDFSDKAFKILEGKGFTGVYAEPSTQGGMGDDFFTAYRGDVRYEGQYDYEEELNDIANIVIDSNAKNREELIAELAEWYANLILRALEPIKDDDLDEDLDTQSTNDLDFNEFLKFADVILVDDAQTFDINQWEAGIKEELESDESDNDSSTITTSKVNFVKYELDNDKVKQIIDKIKTSDINIADYWKTKRFLKKNNLSKSDLDSIIKGIEDIDYRYNSTPISADSDKSEAVIFVKKSNINNLGPFKLYIKLDYDSIENTPIIIISIHPC